MQTRDPQGPGPARPGHAWPTPRSASPGITETVTVTAEVSLIDKDSATIKSALSSDADPWACRSARSTATCRSSSRACSTRQDTIARAERRRQRPGQRLPVRRRQRDAAAVRHALRRARLARHRPGHGRSRAAPGRWTSTAPAASRSTRSASRARASSTARSSYQFQSDAMAADLDSGSLVAVRAGPRLAHRQPRRPDPQGPPLLLRLLLPPDETRDNRVQPLRRAARLREHAQRGLRQADLHARRSHAPPERRATGTRKRVDTGDLFASNASATTGTGNESRQKIFTGDGSWVINPRASSPSSTRTSRTRRRARPDYRRRRRRPTTASGTRLDINSLDTHGPARRSRRRWPARPPTTRSSSPSSTATATRRTACKTGGGTVGYGAQFDDQDFFRDAGADRLQPHARHERAPRAPRRLPVVHRTRRSSSAARTAGASISVPGGRLARVRGPASGPTTPRASSSSRPARRRRSTREYQLAELRAQRHDQVERTGRSTSACC